jgi:Domain of Unknown Function (DUF1206)
VKSVPLFDRIRAPELPGPFRPGCAGHPDRVSTSITAVGRAERSTTVNTLGRAGMVCYGIVHVLVAYLAVRIAVGGGGQQADQKGALEEIATPFGGALLWVLAVGLFAFAGWQSLLAVVGYRWRPEKRKRVTKRLGAAIRVVVGISLTVLAIRLAVGERAEDPNQRQQTFAAKLLSLPDGRILVGLLALVVIGYGVAGIVSGAKRSFMKDLDTAQLPAGSQRLVRRLGMVGYLAKGVAIGIVGVLLGLAALRSDAGAAGGLDAALRTLAGQPFGPVLLVAVAIGFAAFGVYCLAAARSHRV